MKKVKSIANKVKDIQRKVDGVAKKAKSIKNFVDHPVQSTGGYIGGKLGSKKAGSSIGRFLGKISGTGDYVVSANSLATRSVVSESTIPQFNPHNRGLRVTHREYLGDVTASAVAGAFNITQYAINPGLFSTFPWLCALATQYDQWRPNGMVVCVNSLSSTYSGTASLGTIVVATDYDVLDSPYVNKIEMENSEFATSGNSACSFMHPIECNVNERPTRLFNTRSAGVANNDSLRFFDFCNVYVATQGCAANQVVAELWITYDITFYKPQLYGGILGRSLLKYVGEATTGPLATAPYAGMVDFSQSNFFPTFSNTNITFPPNTTGASFLVAIMWTHAASSVTFALSYTSGSSIGAIINPPITTNFFTPTLATNTSSTIIFTVVLSGGYNTTQYISCAPTGMAASANTCNIVITQINPN